MTPRGRRPGSGYARPETDPCHEWGTLPIICEYMGSRSGDAQSADPPVRRLFTPMNSRASATTRLSFGDRSTSGRADCISPALSRGSASLINCIGSPIAWTRLVISSRVMRRRGLAIFASAAIFLTWTSLASDHGWVGAGFEGGAVAGQLGVAFGDFAPCVHLSWCHRVGPHGFFEFAGGRVQRDAVELPDEPVCQGTGGSGRGQPGPRDGLGVRVSPDTLPDMLRPT